MKEALEYYKLVINILREIEFVTSSETVSESAISVKMLISNENLKKLKHVVSTKKFLHELQSKVWSGSGFHRILRQQMETRIADIYYTLRPTTQRCR